MALYITLMPFRCTPLKFHRYRQHTRNEISTDFIIGKPTRETRGGNSHITIVVAWWDEANTVNRVSSVWRDVTGM